MLNAIRETVDEMMLKKGKEPDSKIERYFENKLIEIEIIQSKNLSDYFFNVFFVLSLQSSSYFEIKF